MKKVLTQVFNPFDARFKWVLGQRLHTVIQQMLFLKRSFKVEHYYWNDTRGEIQSDEFNQIKLEIKSEIRTESKNGSSKQSFSGKKYV